MVVHLAFTVSGIDKLLDIMTLLPGLTIGIETVKCSVSRQNGGESTARVGTCIGGLALLFLQIKETQNKYFKDSLSASGCVLCHEYNIIRFFPI